MADLCRGTGASPQSGLGAILVGGSAALAEYLAKRTDRVSAELIAAIVGGGTFLLTDICNSFAPDIPTLTQQDYIDAVTPQNPVTFNTAMAKFRQWTVGQLWPLWCKCGDGLPPSVPVIPAPPTTSENPGLPTGSGSAPCWDHTFQGSLGHQPTPVDVTASVFPLTQPVAVTSQAGAALQVAQKIPDGTNAVHEYIQTGLPPSDNIQPNLTLEAFTATGTSLGTFGGFGGYSLNFDQAITLPPGTASWAAWMTNQNNQPYNWSFRLSFFCNGLSPTVLQQPCCPPDPSLDIKLTQILNLLLSLPTASGGGYVRGTSHSALQGSGSLSVGGLRGVEATVTAGTPTTPILEGNPPYQWNLGWLSASDGGAMLQEQRLTRQHQIWLPTSGTSANTWGYFFNPGVIVNLTELHPA